MELPSADRVGGIFIKSEPNGLDHLDVHDVPSRALTMICTTHVAWYLAALAFFAYRGSGQWAQLGALTPEPTS